MAEDFLHRIQMGQIIKEKEANFLLLFSTFLSTKICGQKRGVISRAGKKEKEERYAFNGQSCN